MNGILNINKPVGMTSHDVVNTVRKCLGIKKVGHTGTLDPDASGVLPICVGRATRIADIITTGEKKYRAVMKLGIITDTQDASGKIIDERDVNISSEMIKNTVKSFVGEIMQVPPMFSALKVNGKKLYELARKGIEVKREPRGITIFDIDIIKIDLENNFVEMDIHCSKGTYIRTLCYDIGNKLGCGAHMKSLIRTMSGAFSIEESIELNAFKRSCQDGNVEELMIPIDRIFNNLPRITVNEDGEKRLVNGNEVSIDMFENFAIDKDFDRYRIYNKEGILLSISQIIKREERMFFKLIKGFY